MTKQEFIERLKNITKTLDNSFNVLKRVTTGNCVHEMNFHRGIISNITTQLKRSKKRHSNLENITKNFDILCNKMKMVSPGNISHTVNNILHILLCLNEKLKRTLKELDN